MAEIIAPPPIPPHPPTPSRDDPATFEERNNAAVEYQFEILPPAIEAVGNAAYQNAMASVSAGHTAFANAGFAGSWVDQAGPGEVPLVVFHGGLFWTLLRPIADVAASEPGPYNLDWVVVGAPSWYNNFAIGDYLDTARSPGAAWLRRNGAAYPISTYPDLAAMMVTVPSSFSFTPRLEPTNRPSAAGRPTPNLIAFNGLLVSWAETATGVSVSADNGETWQFVSAFSTALKMGTAAVFQGRLFIGAEGKYLESSDGYSYQEKTLSGVATAIINFAASPTALIAAGQRLLSPASEGFIKRTTDALSWTNVSVPDLSSKLILYGAFFEQGLFLISSGIRTTLVSTNDGASFVEHTAAAGSENIGLASALVVVNSQLYGLGQIEVGGDDRPAIFNVDPATVAISNIRALPAEITTPANGYCYGMAYNNGKYVVTGNTDRCAYSFDLEDWVLAELPADYEAGWILTIGPFVVMAGSRGEVVTGRFFESDFFRVPSDNPETGWIKATQDNAGTVGYEGVPEAPMTGKDYVRRDGMWAEPAGAGQVNADWDATSGPAQILNKPTIPESPGGAFVGATATQTLTNKTLSAATKESSTANNTGNITINDAASPFQQATLSANRSVTVSLSVGASRTLWVNPGTFTLTWPAGTVWAGGAVPSLPASKWSCITLTGMPGNTAGMAALVGSQP